MLNLAGRREALRVIGVSIVASAPSLPVLSSTSAHAEEPKGLPAGASALSELTERLAKAPRRREFRSVPMILNSPDQWDDEALNEILAYRPHTKQAWDNTDIGGTWLNVMRNSLNAQVWSFKHPDFLVVSATHGSAQLALYDQAMWDKYNLSKLAGSGFTKNNLIVDLPAAATDPTDYEALGGVFSGQNNSVPALQRRGVVFLSCHNAIWEQATRLHDNSQNPDKLEVDALAAELTNHLIDGVVLIPGAVATLPELQQVGFHYAR